MAIRIVKQGAQGVVSSPGGNAVVVPSRHAVDANHLYVWHCGAGCTNGSTVTADKGGVNLTGGSNLASQVSMFKSTPSLINTSSSQTSPGGKTRLTGAINIPTGTSFTVEAQICAPQFNHTASGNYSYGIGIDGTGPQWEGSYVRYRNLSDGSGYFVVVRADASSYTIVQESPFTWGKGLGQISLSEPHHFMLSHEASGSQGVKIYVDGHLWLTTSSYTRRYAVAAVSTEILNMGGSVADIRISNIARSQAYAQDATRIMRGL